ncbi:MAG: anaerobic sulfatase-maturation protein [Paludibacter sp.]|nr:anaerobic sulfatase-maturation protein [Paludibacter sp.]
MSKTIQFNPLKYPVYVMAKPIGPACNLRCSYCYYLDKEGLSPKTSTNRMSDATLELFTEQYINAQPGVEILFTWHGGEPLLLGLDYYRKALCLQKAYGRNRQIDNTLQTNGVLLTEEWCTFFKENNFLIGISIDGPEHCHNKYRRTIQDNGSFQQVLNGIKLLQKHQVEFNVLSVINDYNVQFPMEVYHFFKLMGAKYIQFSPVVERLNAASDFLSAPDNTEGKLTSWSVGSMEYGQFLTTIFDEWVRHDVGETFVTTFDATLASFVGAPAGTCVYSETCGHAAALEANGDLYSCDHFVFPEYNQGNIHKKTITEMMLSPVQFKFGDDKRDKLSSACRQCKYLKLCHGECPKNRILRLADGSTHNYLCTGLKHYFNHVEPYMKFMANELKHKRAPSNVKFWTKTE